MTGKIPCKKCGRPHRRRKVKSKMGTMEWSWKLGGHDYWPMEPMDYVVILLKENRELKKLLKEKP